jgi:predicted TIM-barrel fold metal-dependent hydrolase
MLPDFRLVSADSHVIEPPDLWLKRIQRRYLNRAPRIVSEADSDYFICEGALNEKFGFMTATPPEAKSEDLTMLGRWEAVMRGAYDPLARLMNMDRDDVEAELLYCSLSLPMFAIADLDFQFACFRAYNDWLAEFCEVAPKRLFPIAMIPVNPVERGIAEMQRCRKLGFQGAMISVNQDANEGYEHRRYDPLWSAAEDLRMPISLHVEANKHRPSYNGNMLVETALVFTATMYSVVAMIFSGVFDRHPGLRVVSVENDASWAVAVLERIDYRYERDRSWAGRQYAGITSGRLPQPDFP